MRLYAVFSHILRIYQQLLKKIKGFCGFVLFFPLVLAAIANVNA